MQSQRGFMLGSKMSTWKSLVTWTVEGKSFLSASLVSAQHNPVEDRQFLTKLFVS